MITAAQVWQWMPNSTKREGEAGADQIMDRIVEAVELLWLERWAVLLAEDIDVESSTGVFTSTAHGFANGDQTVLLAVDSDGVRVAGAVYYVRDVAANTFALARTSGGSAVVFDDLDAFDNATTYRVVPSSRPSYIDQALIMQAAALYNRRQTLNGVIAGTTEMGPFRVGRFDPDIERLIDDQSWILG